MSIDKLEYYFDNSDYQNFDKELSLLLEVKLNTRKLVLISKYVTDITTHTIDNQIINTYLKICDKYIKKEVFLVDQLEKIFRHKSEIIFAKYFEPIFMNDLDNIILKTYVNTGEEEIFFNSFSKCGDDCIDNILVHYELLGASSLSFLGIINNYSFPKYMEQYINKNCRYYEGSAFANSIIKSTIKNGRLNILKILHEKCNFKIHYSIIKKTKKISEDIKKYIINSISINEIISNNDINSFKFLCKENNLEITIDMLEESCISSSPEKSFINCCVNKEKQLLVNALIFYGYAPNKRDIILATKHKIEIDNFDDLNFDDNGELLDICVDKKFKPKYFDKLKPPNKIINSNINLDLFKEYISHGYKPNINTFHEVIENVNKYHDIVIYLLDMGIEPDLQCLSSVIERIDNEPLRMIFNKLKIKIPKITI
jgi:hypothetical protein